MRNETVEEYKARGGKVDYLKETDEIQAKTYGHFVYKFNQRKEKVLRKNKSCWHGFPVKQRV